MTMSATCDNIVFTDDDKVATKDPLGDLDMYIGNPKYYRLDETVFAEPIASTNENAINEAVAGSKINFIDNVMIQKRIGKRNKYLIDVVKNSPNPRCPQTNCYKTFSTTTLLRSHIRRVHCAEHNKYVCEFCAAGFSASYLLQRHMAVHSEKKVECQLCGKMLSRRTNMLVHLRRHSNTRPHKCHLCSKSFVRRATLNTHLRFVHRAGDLHCQQCNEKFSSRKLFMNHKSCQPK